MIQRTAAVHITAAAEMMQLRTGIFVAAHGERTQQTSGMKVAVDKECLAVAKSCLLVTDRAAFTQNTAASEYVPVPENQASNCDRGGWHPVSIRMIISAAHVVDATKRTDNRWT